MKTIKHRHVRGLRICQTIQSLPGRKLASKIKKALLAVTCLAAPLAVLAGTPESWTVFSGDWELIDGRLTTQTAGQEAWIWAGAPPALAQGNFDAELDFDFLNIPADAQGRYAGLMLFASVPTYWFEPGMSGYWIDWVDESSQRGFRVWRFDDGVFRLVFHTTQITEPPRLWRLEVRGDLIRLYGDNQLIFEIADGTHRTGYFGLFAAPNNQHISVKVNSIGSGLEVFNTNDSGPGSLRQAILQANAWPGTNVISFNLPNPAARVIAPISPLPPITNPVTLDASAAPDTILDGVAAGAGTHGLVIQSSYTVVRGLTVQRFSGHGILLSNATGCVVQNCWIGWDSKGTRPFGNDGDGIHIHRGANDIIGGEGGTGNVIAGNGQNGVAVRLANPARPAFAVRNVRANLVLANLAAAESALVSPSQQTGVYTEFAAMINYAQGGSGRFAADRPFPGFALDGADDDFVVEATGILTIPTGGAWTFGVNSDDGFACTIGTNRFACDCLRGATDTLATFNLTAGDYPVRLVFFERGGGASVEFFAAPGNRPIFDSAFRLVGDTANGGLAVNTSAPAFAVRSVSANQTLLNLAAAESALTNSSQQTAIYTEFAAMINYAQGGSGRFAGDRPFPGFGLEGTNDDFVVEATGILTIPTGGVWTFGVNSDDGFACAVGTNLFACDCLRGSTDTLATFNLAAGDYPVRLVYFERGGGASVEFFAASGNRPIFDSAFRLVGDTVNGGLAMRSTAGNTIRANSIHSNAGLGIDLGVDGVTPNDAGDADSGPNGLQNFPVLMPYTPSPLGTVVSGTLTSRSNTTYQLDFYVSLGCDSLGNGEGQYHHGTAPVRTGADGNAAFTVTLPALPVGASILTATATDPAGNTSEFSPCALPTAMTITGTLRFTNTNSTILNLLNAPGNEGIQSWYVTAASRPPAAPITAATPEIPAGARTSTPYQITVTGDTNGIAYAVTPRVSLLNNAESYYFNTRTSAVVLANGPPVVLNFEECLGVVTVHFVNSGGSPTPVDGGQILVTGGATRRLSIPSGSTQAHIYLRGGATHALAITVNRGTDVYRDRLTFVLNTNVAAVCDGFTDVNMVVPESGALGRITGQVDMVGEFELTVDGANASNIPDSTGMIAFNGPFQNQRWAAIAGTNFTAPSSGAFVLSNVAPSELSPSSAGYTVYAQMFFRTNRQIQYFRSPALGSGSNAPVVVAAGQTTSLSNLFVFNPGTLRGQILLQGPPERPGDTSQFRGVNHATDLDANGDGIPDLIGTFGVYGTSVGAEGINRRAPGATWTAAYGYANADFDGGLTPATGAFAGSYELRLAGLDSQPGFWSPKYLNLSLSHPDGLSASNYFSSSLAMTDHRGLEVPIVSGQTVTQDLAYCFSEVRILLNSTVGAFYDPEVRASSGSFAADTDFRGQPANYSVVVNTAAGTPNRAEDAATRGVIVMYLPQGNYRLSPSVIFANSNQGRTGLEPIDLTVGCGQRIWVVGSSRVDLQACKLEYSIVSPK